MTKEFFKTPRLFMANENRKWQPLDTEDRYLEVIKKHNICYGPDDIDYVYNSAGFRCDEFDSWQSHHNRILFAGCSLTEGIGLPLKDTWAKIMHERICREFNINTPFWNIAVGGSGLDEMVRYLYHYFDLLRPQIIISNLPEIFRREFWDPESPQFDVSSNQERINTIKLVRDEKFIRYQTEKNFAIMNLLLEKYNSSLVFVTFDENCNISYIKDDLPRINQIDLFPIETEWDLARDGLHAGPNVNRYFANKFFELISDQIKEKLEC